MDTKRENTSAFSLSHDGESCNEMPAAASLCSVGWVQLVVFSWNEAAGLHGNVVALFRPTGCFTRSGVDSAAYREASHHAYIGLDLHKHDELATLDEVTRPVTLALASSA